MALFGNGEVRSKREVEKSRLLAWVTDWIYDGAINSLQQVILEEE